MLFFARGHENGACRLAGSEVYTVCIIAEGRGSPSAAHYAEMGA